MANSIYYLPGYGGRLGTGLGAELLRRGFDVSGRETVGDFKDLTFSDQIAAVAEDLTTRYWTEGSRVIANSFGAYLFLNAQRLIDPYIGKVLLLSPIVGEFSNKETGASFVPPQSGKLFELAESGGYPVPHQCEIHVGEQDWQSIPSSVIRFSGPLGLDVAVVPEMGHMLDKGYVAALLDRWLSKESADTTTDANTTIR